MWPNDAYFNSRNCILYLFFLVAYTKMANNLERAYDKYFAKEFPKFEENSDEDYVDEDENPRKRKRQRNERNLEKVARLTGEGIILVFCLFVC